MCSISNVQEMNVQKMEWAHWRVLHISQSVERRKRNRRSGISELLIKIFILNSNHKLNTIPPPTQRHPGKWEGKKSYTHRMPIPRQFPFLGDSGNRGIAICHSSGIGETKTYSPGFGEFWGVFCFRFEVNLKFLFIEKIFFSFCF
jgi:hypothetical protein